MWSPVVKVSARRSLAEIGARGKRGPGHHFRTKERRELQAIARMRLPEVTKKAA
jgi:hypothetical protein